MWQGKLVPWLHEEYIFRAVMAILVTLSYYHIIWRSSPIVQKVEAIAATIATVFVSIGVMKYLASVSGSWVVAFIFGVVLNALRTFLMELEKWYWRDVKELQFISVRMIVFLVGIYSILMYNRVPTSIADVFFYTSRIYWGVFSYPPKDMVNFLDSIVEKFFGLGFEHTQEM
eukprot:TRINITY_DN742_c0_g1_i3.p1 TRINITY_DN742_c0_g1~~TRINITY_DN742_c0_g1_i3.p1  ORF type:complete len:172 (-),score=18.60 TRINITY_DN742_c0_g1_i3:190-705(-)